MSETNQNPTASAPDKREGGNEKNPNRRNRHRPHHRGGGRPSPSVEKKQDAAKGADAVSRPETRNEKKQSNPRNNNEKKKNGQQNQQNRSRNGRGQNRGRQFDRRDRESRVYDPYEAPSKQEIELSELRAQIVLQAADGTHPEAYGTELTKQEPVAPTEPVAEAVTPVLSTSETPTPEAAPQKKIEVIGVRFRSAGKMYYFDPHGITARKGDCAIVETTRGPEFGDVCLGNAMVNASETVTPLRPVLRIATPEDIARNAENRKKEEEALSICRKKILAHGLEMKLIDVQYAFDGSKLLFYFSAEGRVDFRELVKDLAGVFRTRIELRQIGIRDEAKMLGGIGACGRRLCCSTFLPDFAQVSIKMAKDQNLSLNSAKISGVCGRLMCCLRYESEVYAEEIRRTPANDTLVRTEDGVGVVISSNPLAGTVRVILKDSPDTAPKQYHRDSVTVIGKNHKGSNEDKKSAEK